MREASSSTKTQQPHPLHCNPSRRAPGPPLHCNLSCRAPGRARRRGDLWIHKYEENLWILNDTTIILQKSPAERRGASASGPRTCGRERRTWPTTKIARSNTVAQPPLPKLARTRPLSASQRRSCGSQVQEKLVDPKDGKAIHKCRGDLMIHKYEENLWIRRSDLLSTRRRTTCGSTSTRRTCGCEGRALPTTKIAETTAATQPTSTLIQGANAIINKCEENLWTPERARPVNNRTTTIRPKNNLAKPPKASPATWEGVGNAR